MGDEISANEQAEEESFDVALFLGWQKSWLHTIGQLHTRREEVERRIQESNSTAYEKLSRTLKTNESAFQQDLQALLLKHGREDTVAYDDYHSTLEGNASLLLDVDSQIDWEWVKFYKDFRDHAPAGMEHFAADFFEGLSADQQRIYLQHFGGERFAKLRASAAATGGNPGAVAAAVARRKYGSAAAPVESAGEAAEAAEAAEVAEVAADSTTPVGASVDARIVDDSGAAHPPVVLPIVPEVDEQRDSQPAEPAQPSFHPGLQPAGRSGRARGNQGLRKGWTGGADIGEGGTVSPLRGDGLPAAQRQPPHDGDTG